MEQDQKQQVQKQQDQAKDELNKQSFLKDFQSRNRGGKYFMQGLTAFLVIAAAVVLVFFFYSLDSVARVFGVIWGALTPIIYGAVIAYLLNPIVSFLDRRILPLLLKKAKKKNRAVKGSRALSVVIAVLFALILLIALIYMVAPQLSETVAKLAKELPNQIRGFLDWFNGLIKTESKLTEVLETGVVTVTALFEDFIESLLSGEFSKWLDYVFNGVWSVVSVVYNLVIGTVFSIYILLSKEKFAAQAKKLLYAFIRPKRVDSMLDAARQCHQIFNGAITGKILDSAIIGLICFLGMTILNLPYAMLISIIVGVTNVIPFFGPYIGAVPSALLVLIVDPWQCLYFVIFIIILQQFDCNYLDPRIVGGSIGLSPFWTLFACIFFGGVFGIAGLLLGVPAFACIYTVVKRIVELRLKRRGLYIHTEEYINQVHLGDIAELDQPAKDKAQGDLEVQSGSMRKSGKTGKNNNKKSDRK